MSNESTRLVACERVLRNRHDGGNVGRVGSRLENMRVWIGHGIGSCKEPEDGDNGGSKHLEVVRSDLVSENMKTS